MTAMSHHSGAERLLGTLHEVVASTAMAMKLYATRNHMHPQGVYRRVGTWLDVAVLADLHYA